MILQSTIQRRISDPLKVTVNINQTGGVASLKSVEQNGSGYKLNDALQLLMTLYLQSLIS